jgi:hypothetical protein
MGGCASESGRVKRYAHLQYPDSNYYADEVTTAFAMPQR